MIIPGNGFGMHFTNLTAVLYFQMMRLSISVVSIYQSLLLFEILGVGEENQQEAQVGSNGNNLVTWPCYHPIVLAICFVFSTRFQQEKETPLV